MRINELRVKDEQVIPLGDFTVLVGPNNVGKSQTLRDIHTKMSKGIDARTVLVESLQIPKPNQLDEVFRGLELRDHSRHVDHKVVRGIASTLRGAEEITFRPSDLEQRFERSEDAAFLLASVGKFWVSYLDASSRLQVAQARESIDAHSQAPESLVQGLYVSGRETEGQLREVFRATFGMDVRLDYSALRTLNLRVAQEFPEIPDDPRDALPIMRRYNRLDVQGDGFRSFVGVVLSLLLSEGRVILLDEPEAFLHPAQARQLGSWVARQSRIGGNQVLVATHNAHFLRGILDSGEGADIFRLNRSGNRTTYTRLPSEAVDALTNSPLLSGQRVLEAVFHRGVVVAEADADRTVYQAVANRAADGREVLFIHAQSKHTVREVAGLLRSANIPVRCIVDLDIVHGRADLERLLESLTDHDIAVELGLRDRVAGEVEGRADEEILQEMQKELNELLAELDEAKHTVSGARSALGRIRASASRWREIKKRGLDALEGPVREAGEELLDRLRIHGLFAVPVGELESWIEVGTRKKQRWVVLALAKIDQGATPEPLRIFVSEVLDSFREGANEEEVSDEPHGKG